MFLIDFTDEFIFQKLEKTMCDATLNLGGSNEALWEKVTISTVKNTIKKKRFQKIQRENRSWYQN